MTDTLPDPIARKIRASFDAQSMMQTLGAALVEIAPGRVQIAAPILPGSRQQHGFAHAALPFAIGDSAAGYAALTLMPEPAEVLTSEIKINLLAPGRGVRLLAEGRVIKPGRRLIVVTSDIWAEDETGQHKHIALIQGTMVPVHQGASPASTTAAR